MDLRLVAVQIVRKALTAVGRGGSAKNGFSFH